MNRDKKNIVISSKDSIDFYSLNTQTHFTHILNKPIAISPYAKIALRQIVITLSAPITSPNPVILDLFLEQITGNIYKGSESTLLKRVIFDPKQSSTILAHSFSQLDFVKLKSTHICQLDFTIKTVIPQNLSFDQQAPSLITLALDS